MAPCVVDLSGGAAYSIPRRANGQVSSRKVEPMGLLATNVIISPRQDSPVLLENEDASSNFRMMSSLAHEDYHVNDNEQPTQAFERYWRWWLRVRRAIRR